MIFAEVIKKIVLKIEIQIQRAERKLSIASVWKFLWDIFFFFWLPDLFENTLLSTYREKNTPTNSLEELCNVLCTTPNGLG